MKYLLISLITLSCFISCNQAELEQAKQSADSLAVVLHERDSVLNDFLFTFNQIERNLDSISIRQNFITVNTEKPGEMQMSVKDRINAEIEAINQIMERNNKRIADLGRKLKNSNSKITQLEKTIALLNEQLLRKNTQLAELNDKLAAMGIQLAELQISVDTLSAQNIAQAAVIAEQTSALHTAYYIIGTSKELQQSEVIDKSGGLLGIGKTSTLSEDFDTEKFTKIDYTETKNITVESKNIKLVTTHPSGTYGIEEEDGKVKGLIITDPEKFWSASKYLVIIKD